MYYYVAYNYVELLKNIVLYVLIMYNTQKNDNNNYNA